ncbi:hypothetical protein [Bradyrhizobium nanningense]|nr:hypothetical protein [Bradyrhizobium nanningense]RXH34360.1 hypothetical protein XH84_06985 [Bradyrhizobium nanningense]
MIIFDRVELALLLENHTPEEIRELRLGISDEEYQAGLELWRVLEWWGMGWLKRHQHPAHKQKGN